MSQNFKIIIIDDEIGIIDTIKEELEEKYVVDGCTTSRDGIEKIKNEKYDVLLLDYFIDDLNGKNVIDIIRGFDNEIQIILLTGHKEDLPPRQTLDTLDIQGYCEKSADFEKIIVFIESSIKSILFQRKEETFSSRLKNLRKEKGVSQDDLAKYLGIKRPAVAQWEADNNDPTLDNLKKIAEYFKVSIDYLTGYQYKTKK